MANGCVQEQVRRDAQGQFQGNVTVDTEMQLREDYPRLTRTMIAAAPVLRRLISVAVDLGSRLAEQQVAIERTIERHRA